MTKRYAIQYDYHCGSPFTDKEVTLLTTDKDDPLDWDNPVAYFASEGEALSFMDDAYATIIDYHHDWQAVELNLVEI